MTQRVARPMKFAAFISIIISVAVLFVACQGAVGPAGADGKDGVDGVDGTDGVDGQPAFQPLATKEKSPFVVISDAEDADGTTIPGPAATIDLAEYIRGSAERTYGTPTSGTTTTADQVFDAKIEGSMLTITPKATQPAGDAAAYAVEIFKVAISDGGESMPIELDIPARRNRAPTAPTSDGAGEVGTQVPATAPDSASVCPAADECYIVVEFGDPDGATESSAEKLSFTATSPDTAKVEVVSVDNGEDEDGNALPLVAWVVVKGISSTWDNAETNPDHDPCRNNRGRNRRGWRDR